MCVVRQALGLHFAGLHTDLWSVVEVRGAWWSMA